MPEVAWILLYTLLAGACIPLGGLLARNTRIRPAWLENEFRHFVIAFGGGILAAAVALVLVPEGSNFVVNPFVIAAIFVLGGIFFFGFEWHLGKQKREKPQLTAMLLDFLPESLALGGAFALGSHSAPLLALFIGLQNIPEGFNAYRELEASGNHQGRHTLLFMSLLVPLGPLFGLLGWIFLSTDVVLLGGTMLFASGGILYLIFQDIAPQSRMKRHWAPPLGAVLGFAVGMLGERLVGY